MTISFYLKATPKFDGELRVQEFFKFQTEGDEKRGNPGHNIQGLVEDEIVKQHTKEPPLSNAYTVWRKFYEENKAECDKRALAGEEVYLPVPEVVKAEEAEPEKKVKEKKVKET